MFPGCTEGLDIALGVGGFGRSVRRYGLRAMGKTARVVGGYRCLSDRSIAKLAILLSRKLRYGGTALVRDGRAGRSFSGEVVLDEP